MKRILAADAGPRPRRGNMSAPSSASRNNAAASQAAASRRRRGAREASEGGTSPVSRISSSSSARSRALCQRRSASFSIHRRISLSSAGGVIGWRVARESGSELMIAEMSNAWLAPENAFLPVAIS